jgi:4-hydroxy-tetrahydrodipicolinate reductase
MSIKICLAGAGGNAGRQLARAVLDAEDLELTAAVGHKSAGRPLAGILGDDRTSLTVESSVAAALQKKVDVFIDYTRPEVVRKHVTAAIAAGSHVVVGTSGLSDEEYAEIDRLALKHGVGVLAAGNFSITATLMQYFATLAKRFLPCWEILDYAPDSKPDAPSGTARELAFKMSRGGRPRWAVAPEDVLGLRESRGAGLNGSRVHSVRVPGVYSSAEIIFGLPGERLTLRHDSISHQPYVDGTLLAVRRVPAFRGLRRGLDSILEIQNHPEKEE